jgi:hypothetical protein
LTYYHCETLHNLQISTDHTKPGMEKRPHRASKGHPQHNVANGVASLRTKKLRATASDQEISFSNDNEQLNKIPVIENCFTAHSDTSEVQTVVQINSKGNDRDTVLINDNTNSRCKSSAQNTFPSVKSDSDSDSEHSRNSLLVTSHYRMCKQN